MHRIVESLRVGHELYHQSLRQLCQAIYDWDEGDFSELVRNLKQGLMGTDGKKWMDEEIDKANMTKSFKDRFGAYLKKKIHPPEIIEHKLQVWFDIFKGQVDSTTGKFLFTMDTKTTVEEQKRMPSTSATHCQ